MSSRENDLFFFFSSASTYTPFFLGLRAYSFSFSGFIDKYFFLSAVTLFSYFTYAVR